MSIEDEVQAAAETGSIIIGTEETLKHIDTVDKVVIAANAPADIRADVAAAAESADVAVTEADIDNQDLGSLCMEPFSASVVGIK
ncbi:MAG: ribosomal L7Ae/L30e/S12e/Gadd45 family protein [Candidatus Nanohaloarchaea archaeon]